MSLWSFLFGVKATVNQISVVQLTNAQILAMHTTPVQLLPSPGPGKMILVSSFKAHYHYNNAPFTGSPTLNIFYSGSVASPYATRNVSALAWNSSAEGMLPIPETGLFPWNQCVNQPLMVSLDGPVTGGGNSVVRIVVEYTVISP